MSDPRLLVAEAHKLVRDLAEDLAADKSAIVDLEAEWPHIMAALGLPSSGRAEDGLRSLRVVEAVVMACLVRLNQGHGRGLQNVRARLDRATDLLEAIEERIA